MQTRRRQAVQCFVGLIAAFQLVGCSVIGHFVGSAIDGPSYTQVSLSAVDTLAVSTPVEVTMKDESSIEGKIDGVELDGTPSPKLRILVYQEVRPVRVDTVLVPFEEVKEVLKVNSRTGRRVGTLVGAAIDATAMILAVENQHKEHWADLDYVFSRRSH